MNIQRLNPGSWGSNCYILSSKGHAALVDPSVDATRLLSEIRANGATLEMILLTHGHFDHIVSIDKLRELSGVPVWIHEDDAEMLTDAKKNAFYTFFGLDRCYAKADRLLRHGDKLLLGDETIEVIHTPGHSKGSVCYLCNDALLLTGDTLFEEGYGRYDLWGGSIEALRKSLASLRALPKDLPIYPGHGDSTRLSHALDTVIY